MTNFFGNNTKRGELQELDEDLNSLNFERKKEAVKKVIAHMTVGKDVSPIFQSVIKCLEHPDIELKKLVYLYIINYSRTKPDDAIMVIALFRKDIEKGSPLIKALAVRTMGCLRVQKLNEYLVEPLKSTLLDTDPYVRKTAVLCVPKVYQISPQLVETYELIPILLNMLEKEGNALVIANLVSSIVELSELKGKNILKVNNNILKRLLLAVNECIEWGQVLLLDCLTNYLPSDESEAEMICERITPRLVHINPAVVFSAVKVLIKMMDSIKSSEFIRNLNKKISPALITLVSWNQPEIQYTILRNISFILQKRPDILERNIKVFFCKYNDPHYIKADKLDIIMRLCDSKNNELVISELKEYSNEVDPEFVRKCIRSIARIGLQFEKSVEKAISALLSLFKEARFSKSAPHVLNEVLTQMKHILRKYPSKWNFELCLRELIDAFDMALDDSARASVFWLLGEFTDEIKNHFDILGEGVEKFSTYDRSIQLQILTAAVKIFLKYPEKAEEIITKLLELATSSVESPDIRDRAYIYWRMLSTEPEKTKRVVLSEKPDIKYSEINYEDSFVDSMIKNLGLVSTVFHLQAESFCPLKVDKTIRKDESVYVPETKTQEKATVGESKNETEKKSVLESTAPKSKPSETNNSSNNTPSKAIIDLLDLDTKVEPEKSKEKTMGNLLDILDDEPVKSTGAQPSSIDLFAPNFISGSTGSVLQPVTALQKSTSVPFEMVLRETIPGIKGGVGLRIEAAFDRENNKTTVIMRLKNLSQVAITEFEIQLKPNFFGLVVEKPASVFINPNSPPVELRLGIQASGATDISAQPSVPLILTFGLKCNIDIFYFSVPCMLHVLLNQGAEVNKEYFKNLWKSLPQSNEMVHELQNYNKLYALVENLKETFKKNNIFFASQATNDKMQNTICFTAKTLSDVFFLAEIRIPSNNFPSGCTIVAKCMNSSLLPLFLQCLSFILSS